MSLFSNRRVDDRKQILHAMAHFGRQDLLLLHGVL